MKFVIFLSLVLSQAALSDSLPPWIKGGKLSDGQFHYVVCSHNGIDPQEARIVAEEKCLSQAAKLGGVEITLNQKTVQGLAGADASEVSEITSLTKKIKCEWTDHHLESIDKGFRVWLRCRVKKSDVENLTGTKTDLPQTFQNPTPKYQRAYLTLTSAPTPDKLIIHGQSGERVVEVKSNVIRLELREGDHAITIKKHRYKDQLQKLSTWKHGDTLTMTVFLEQEI